MSTTLDAGEDRLIVDPRTLGDAAGEVPELVAAALD